MYVDAHCHLSDERFGSDLEQVLLRANAAGIHRFVLGGFGPGDWRRQLELKRVGWRLSFGLHPWFVAKTSEETCREALLLLEEMTPQADAIGELGLDYAVARSEAERAHQRRFFELQLELAVAKRYPLVLHLVRCHGEAVPILRPHAPLCGIVHGFSGSPEVAEAYLAMGLLISVGGAVTRNGYRQLKKTVVMLPDDRLVVESDAPDMTPVGYHSQRNEPESLAWVAQTVARLRGTSTKRVLEQSTINIDRVFEVES